VWKHYHDESEATWEPEASRKSGARRISLCERIMPVADSERTYTHN